VHNTLGKDPHNIPPGYTAPDEGSHNTVHVAEPAVPLAWPVEPMRQGYDNTPVADPRSVPSEARVDVQRVSDASDMPDAPVVVQMEPALGAEAHRAKRVQESGAAPDAETVQAPGGCEAHPDSHPDVGRVYYRGNTPHSANGDGEPVDLAVRPAGNCLDLVS